jgi:hypothetical protein
MPNAPARKTKGVHVPRYFFNFRNGKELLDDEGVEFASAADARAEAVGAAGESLKDAGGRFWEAAEWRMWVTDEVGATVCSLRCSAD